MGIKKENTFTGKFLSVASTVFRVLTSWYITPFWAFLLPFWGGEHIVLCILISIIATVFSIWTWAGYSSENKRVASFTSWEENDATADEVEGEKTNPGLLNFKENA